VEGHLLAEHVHMCIEIPPQRAVALIIGFLKGKSAVAIAGNLGEAEELYGEAFLGAGLCGVDSGL
jgi:putative transposase